MHAVTGNEGMKAVARELFWWETPEAAMANPRRFLAQVMTLGTWDEVKKTLRQFGLEAFRDAILNAPPGIFDVRSWYYWRAVLRLPEAGLPVRSLK